ncbi:MAG: hypothetical protein S4CHLAM45_15310 [Chlamydiales bacterium]|nr:hypothetical protein [Chlamydiales bacterium]MCH9620148.1 hypothetical protein [Chlamydiales bacterium]MCH9623618.1 hypothetical protein [Chlamydiales bacterium]
MITEFNLAWIVVDDLQKAIKYYTEIIGLKVVEVCEDFGWAELSPQKGDFRLGIAQKSDHERVQPGSNAITAFCVENLEESIKDLKSKGVEIIGDVMVIPEHVKLQMIKDPDGNQFQLVEKIS